MELSISSWNGLDGTQLFTDKKKRKGNKRKKQKKRPHRWKKQIS